MGAIRRVVAGSILGAAATALWSLRIAPGRLEIVRLSVQLPGLPHELRGLHIAHLSDFHAGGPGVRLELLHRAREAALEFRPEIIALTGDFYDNCRKVETAGLWSSWPPGTVVVGVLGNHDYRSGPQALDALLAELAASGVTMLRNDAAAWTVRGCEVWVVGVEDPFTLRADEQGAFGKVPDSATALLYLAHSPSADERVPVGRARLMLSGHTHGGQIRITSSGRVPLARLLRRVTGTPRRRDPPAHRGWHWLRGMVVVISEGLGMSRLPLRFRTRPQVILLELEPARPYGAACDSAERYVSRR